MATTVKQIRTELARLGYELRTKVESAPGVRRPYAVVPTGERGITSYHQTLEQVAEFIDAIQYIRGV